jgi:hypothetical protein
VSVVKQFVLVEGKEVEAEIDLDKLIDEYDDKDLEDECRDRGIWQDEPEDMSIGDMIEALESHGYEVKEESSTDPAGYVEAALRDALADHNTPRSFRDLLYFVHGRLIA